jgi:hypothetical protein
VLPPVVSKVERFLHTINRRRTGNEKVVLVNGAFVGGGLQNAGPASSWAGSELHYESGQAQICASSRLALVTRPAMQDRADRSCRTGPGLARESVAGA